MILLIYSFKEKFLKNSPKLHFLVFVLFCCSGFLLQDLLLVSVEPSLFIFSVCHFSWVLFIFLYFCLIFLKFPFFYFSYGLITRKVSSSWEVFLVLSHCWIFFLLFLIPFWVLLSRFWLFLILLWVLFHIMYYFRNFFCSFWNKLNFRLFCGHVLLACFHCPQGCCSAQSFFTITLYKVWPPFFFWSPQNVISFLKTCLNKEILC